MSILQIIIIAILVYAFYRGYKKGFLSQLAAFLGLFLAYSLTSVFYKNLNIFLVEHKILSETSANYLSYILCFILIVALVRIFAILIERLFKLLNINFVNKFFGGVFSFLLIAFILSFAIHFGISLHIFPIPDSENPNLIYYLDQLGQILMQSNFE